MKATPLTRTESVREPPATFFTPIIFKLRSSSSDKTASTAISPKNSFWWAMSLEFSAVCAHFSSRDLCSLRATEHARVRASPGLPRCWENQPVTLRMDADGQVVEVLQRLRPAQFQPGERSDGFAACQDDSPGCRLCDTL